jgi:glycosyltransferase involved in cell wall biosynthesis
MISICTTHKNRSKVQTDNGVLNLFPRSVESLSKLTEEIELVVSDWKSTDWPIREWIFARAEGKFPVTIVDVEEEWFSRGKGLNIAAENANKDILFFIDSDILLTDEVVRDAKQKCEEGVAFYPVCMREKPHRHKWRHSGYGLCAMTREMWIKAGKWVEWSSWGGEDNILHDKLIENGYDIYRDTYEGFTHLDHPEDYSAYKMGRRVAFKRHRRGR